MTFLDTIESTKPLPWSRVASRLGDENLSLAEVAALLSNDADAHLEAMAQAAHALTRKRFGRTIKLYAPIYISNSCVNGCRYCGFNRCNATPRTTLSTDVVIAEAEALLAQGHRHLLLVAGEDPKAVPLDLLEAIARAIRPKAAGLAIEVQPFDETGYRRLAQAGVDGVTLYQETYDEQTYTLMHPTGPKSIFASRMNAIDAAGAAGMRFLGLGALLGLSDWRTEALQLIAHARALMKRYWQAHITVSVPRIRDCASDFQMPSPTSDRDLAHMICALRLSLPDCGIVLSTREPASLRDRLLPLGVTQMSAGSATAPGGYTQSVAPSADQEQFHIADERSPDAVARMLREKGYDPVWKDWDRHLA